MIICHDHAKGLQSTSTDVADQSVAAVTIQKKAYIGAGAILLPGVIIGENAVVGAGAVVTKDVRPGATVVGIPAKELPAKS
jgi:maltose O-acetyltransferase